MPKKKGNLYGKVIPHEPVFHKTSIGRKPSLAKMNKNKRRQFKFYKGQGKLIKDLAFIQMASLYLFRCHKILECQRVEVVVVIVVYILTDMVFVVCIEQEVLKIHMFATNGDKDILKDD